MNKHLICPEEAMAAMKRMEAEDLEEFGVRVPETFNAKRACEALLGLSWEGFRELTGKSEKEVQQINLRLWARGHTDRMNRMISQGRRRR